MRGRISYCKRARGDSEFAVFEMRRVVRLYKRRRFEELRLLELSGAHTSEVLTELASLGAVGG